MRESRTNGCWHGRRRWGDDDPATNMLDLVAGILDLVDRLEGQPGLGLLVVLAALDQVLRREQNLAALATRLGNWLFALVALELAVAAT